MEGRKKEDGRPRGTYKIYSFDQTRLGFLLKYEAPLVYKILRSLLTTGQRKAPPFELIKTVCEASDDPTLRKAKFYRYLAEYEKDGVCCRRPKLPTPERMVYYHNLRRRKMEAYLKRMQRETPP